MMSDGQESDICLIVEGAYPFVVGGVSSWLQDLILAMPDLRFSLVAIKAGNGAQPWRMATPSNVVGVVEIPLLIEPCLRRERKSALLGKRVFGRVNLGGR